MLVSKHQRSMLVGSIERFSNRNEMNFVVVLFVHTALASRSVECWHEQQKQRGEHRQHEDEQQTGERLKKNGIVLSVPGSLATVLENLPLVYDTNEKSLQQAATNVRNGDVEEETSFKRGHHRRSSYESAQIQLTHHTRHAGFLRTCSADKSATAPISYQRSHLHSSPSFMDELPPFAGSKHFSPSISFKDDDGSVEGVCDRSSKNPSLASLTTVTTTATTTTTATSATTGATADSAVVLTGESLSSKRSSLDRRSELSVSVVVDDDSVADKGDDNDDDSIESDNEDAVTDGGNDGDKARRRRNKKGGRTALSLLPSINFTRKLFSRNKQQQTSSWRIFGVKQWKNTAGEEAAANTAGATCKCTTDDMCCSTTGLILEDRPSTLPAKSAVEQRRHEAEYSELIEAMKRKEARRARQRQQFLEMKRKEEDETAAAAQVWCSCILPNWEHMKETKRCRELWWRGIPSKVRGHVWSLAIGNELNLTPELYEICVARARQHVTVTSAVQCCSADDNSTATTYSPAVVEQQSISPIFSKDGNMERQIGRENTLDLIHLDVSRTFPHLGFFQKGGPYEELLLDLLGAYVCYRPDIGYVQSMCFLGAMLLLQMHLPYQSFQAFANLLNRPLMLAFFGLRQPQMTVYFIAYDQYFEQELPKLHHHFDVLDVRPDLYLIEWLYTLYAKSLPFDVSCRVWDVFLRDGEQFLFNTALGIMHLYESELENMDDFDAVVHFLTHLPQSMNVSQLFDAIEPFMKSSSSGANSDRGSGKRRSFQQIYTDVSERIAQAATIARGVNIDSLMSSPVETAHPFRSSSSTANTSAALPNTSRDLFSDVLEKGGKDEGSLSSPSCASVEVGDSARNPQKQKEEEEQAAALRCNVSSMKMSKSLSGFLDDLLRSIPSREENAHTDAAPKKSRAPTAV